VMAEKRWKLLTLRCGSCKVLVNEDLEGWATETCEGHKQRMREAGAEMPTLPVKLAEPTVVMALMGVLMGAGTAEDLGVWGNMEEALEKAAKVGELGSEDWVGQLAGLVEGVELSGKEEDYADKGSNEGSIAGLGSATEIEKGGADDTGTIAAE